MDYCRNVAAETGGSITRPENINGNWNVNAGFTFNTALDSTAHWNIGTDTRLRYNNFVSYVAQQQAAGDMRDMQEIAVEYNDNVIYPDKVRLNCYYYRHYSFIKDIQMILCTVLGKKMEYAGEVI